MSRRLQRRVVQVLDRVGTEVLTHGGEKLTRTAGSGDDSGQMGPAEPEGVGVSGKMVSTGALGASVYNG